MKETEPQLTIASVEREVGLSKDVLRVWERRYGFPVPVRDRNDERLYPAEQVRRLRLVKRLMDQGHRPGRLLRQSTEDLERLALAPAPEPSAPGAAAPGDATTSELLECLRSHDAAALEQRLRRLLAARGLERFVQDIVVPVAVAVGEEWARGRLQVFEEHLFSEACARVLRQAIAALPPGIAPRILLTTAPGEPHALGLLIVESLLTLHRARCISLGAQTPVGDVARAAGACGADVVALSFSAAFPARRITHVLRDLREALPTRMALWAGGAGVQRLGPVEGVQVLPDLAAAIAAVGAGQAQR
ncbi:MerR family transcriptional regulator [Ramlibacter sp. AN1133]|uniref:MerR family transcriptional regulator n=1 Tax=Ramlibacter sp. AN1133 TaxID=3133429 RepID=UPI0030BFABCA